MGWYSDSMANWLHTAIAQDSFCEARLSVALGANVNKPDQYGRPPLWHSIVTGKDDVIVLLLKNKADPNQHYKDLFKRNVTHSIVQGSIYGENKSLIQLLILHGGTVQFLIYEERHLYLKEVVIHAEKLFQKLRQLQAQLEQNNKHPWIYRELAHFWQEVSMQESNATFRAYYAERSQTMLHKAEELIKETKKKGVKSGFHHLTLEEKMPLLTTAENITSGQTANFSLYLKRE